MKLMYEFPNKNRNQRKNNLDHVMKKETVYGETE